MIVSQTLFIFYIVIHHLPPHCNIKSVERWLLAKVSFSQFFMRKESKSGTPFE